MSPVRRVQLHLLMAAGAALLAPGCLPPLHQPPPEGQPASTLKFRIQHHHNPGGQLAFRLLIDGNRLPHQPPLLGPSGTWTRAAPGWRRLDLGSDYFVTYTTSYNTTVSESYSCGKSTCTRSVNRTVTQTHTRYLGRCRSALAVHLDKDRSYLLGYSYLGHGSCTLTCHVQVFAAGGQFRLEPCPYTQRLKPET